MEGSLGLMCVHAHPDDETIITGGVLARAAHEGIRTAVVTCTGGELGEVVGEGMDPAMVAPRLAEVRQEELAKALAILGAGTPRFLGYRDSGMWGTEGNEDPSSFWRATFHEAVGRLVAQIREFRPDVLVTYDAFGNYGHPDHIQAHRVALVAAEAAPLATLYPGTGQPWKVRKVYQATIARSQIVRANTLLAAEGLPSPFGTVTDPDELPFGLPDRDVTTAVDVRPWLELKWQALHAHHSQLGPDSFFLNVPEGLREEAFGTEWFALHTSGTPTTLPEDDLFAGLR